MTRWDRYGYASLLALQERGVTELQIWCVHLPCTNWRTAKIADLIEQLGPGTSLVMIARRVSCKLCGAKGGHVQPADKIQMGLGKRDDYDAWRWLD